MVPNESVVSGGGVVNLLSATGVIWPLFVAKLSMAGEKKLAMRLASGAKAKMGPGGYFQSTRGVLNWLKENKLMNEFSISCQRITEMEATRELPTGTAFDEFRQSPEGVAIELYERTRQSHAEIRYDEIQAVITEINAFDIHDQMMEAITDDKKSA